MTVQVRQPDGSLEPQTRTLYSTATGPIFNSLLGLPLFPWTPAHAPTRWATPTRTTSATSTTSSRSTGRSRRDELLDDPQAQPGDPVGQHDRRRLRGQRALRRHSVDPQRPRLEGAGRATRRARRGDVQACSGCRSSTARARRASGTTTPTRSSPASSARRTCRTCSATTTSTNSNDSYWLANPQAAARGLRADHRRRAHARARCARASGSIDDRAADRGTDGRRATASRCQQLQDMVFNDRQYAGELWRDELVADRARRNPIMLGSNGPVDVSAACPVLARLGPARQPRLASGAMLFRRFASHALGADARVAARLVHDAVRRATTRSTRRAALNTATRGRSRRSPTRSATCSGASIPLDAPLRGYQYERRGGEQIPIHGGPGDDGDFNAINVRWVAGKGYTDVAARLELRAGGRPGTTGRCPRRRARSSPTRSRPTRRSPYFADQTRMFPASSGWTRRSARRP